MPKPMTNIMDIYKPLIFSLFVILSTGCSQVESDKIDNIGKSELELILDNYSVDKYELETVLEMHRTKKSRLKIILRKLGAELKSNDLSIIKKITTKNGYESIFSWSDSLRNKNFVSTLSNDLLKFNVFDYSETDSSITLSLGKTDEILGATHGYLYLIKGINEMKIEEFRGGE